MLPRVNHIKCNDADYLLFATNDAISLSLYSTGQWESHLLSISRMFYKNMESPVILDIGANLGAYSIPIAKEIQRAGGMVFGFEPQRIIFYQLCGNIFLNRLDNYMPFNQAVSDEQGLVEIPEIDYEKNRNIGAFSLDKKSREFHRIENSMKEQSCRVPSIKLDHFSCRSPTLIKIDVEGYEINVLKGGAQFLETHKFPPILFEAWNFDWFKEKRDELMQYITRLGYNITSISTMDYIAQHPGNPVEVKFSLRENKSLEITRVR
jgi:FkbM family methyltransferase